MIHRETAKDNQWWYGHHPAANRLDATDALVLHVNGRPCPVTHSALGRDGRVTRSFTFNSRGDRAYWMSLRGQTVTIEIALGPAREAQPALGQAAAPPAAERVALPVASLLPAGPIRRRGSTLFDAYLMCDWSSNSTPKEGLDSLWIGAGWFDETGLLQEAAPLNPPTRRQADGHIQAWLARFRRERRRVLLGFDFPLGFPAPAATRLSRNAPGWRAPWQHLLGRIADGANNANNRFDVAAEWNQVAGTRLFWGVPAGSEGEWLRSRRDDGRHDVPEWRLVEDSLRRSGLRPKSVWQLFGNGSVGSQALVGLPLCERLRANDAHGLRVWPFETRLAVPERGMDSGILVEIWPGAVPFDVSLHATKDAAQMRSVVRWAAGQDAAGDLGSAFSLGAIRGDERERVERFEGWILGWGP